MRFSLPRAVVAAVAVVVSLEILVIIPRPAALAMVASILWMALPGVVLIRRAVGVQDASGMAAWLAGPAIGFAFSVFGALLFWSVGLQSWLTILLAPSLTWLVAFLARRFGGPRLRLPVFDRRDVVAVAIALLVVPAVTWSPYDHVREPVADGDAYRAYFTADFIWAMTVTGEIAKGQVPPVNPFLADETLHYYWMAHFLSGVLYHNVRHWGVLAEQVILVDGLAYGLAFAAFFYFLVRMVGASPAFAALAVIIGFMANSYEGANRLWVLSERGLPISLVRDYNIDAVTRWFYQGMPVDGLQRLLLYQPHHLTGYVTGLAALWLVAFAEDPTDIWVALWAGILLGFTFLFSTFTALILGVAVGLLYAIRLAARRAFRAAVWCAILGGGPALIGAALTRVMGYTDPEAGTLLDLGLNRVAARGWPFMLLLSFGPLLFAGLLGLARLAWVRRDGAAPAVLVVVALAFYFLIDVPNMEGVWVGWRSGHQLLIAFSAIGAAALSAAWRVRRLRLPIVLAIALAIIPAVPTVAIDVYNAQDITNRDRGPNFPWTLIVTPAEREALEWLKRATPPDARVQFEPTARGNTHWAYLPAFGERRMSAGFPSAMIPFRKYEEASRMVQTGIFQAFSPEEARAMAEHLKIDYLFVSDIERRQYPAAIKNFDSRPDLFPPVFTNGSITIYGVIKTRRANR